jgi:peptide/nickel transport system substrate-binding protein
MFQGRKRVGALRLVGLGLLLVALSAFTAASLEQLQVGVYVNSSEVVVYWDPSETFSNEVIIMNNVYETLLRYDPFKDKFEPVLAESYERSADGLTWTFHLRKGVKFHTGGRWTLRQ